MGELRMSAKDLRLHNVSTGRTGFDARIAVGALAPIRNVARCWLHFLRHTLLGRFHLDTAYLPAAIARAQHTVNYVHSIC